MRLILAQYLRTLKERDEFDRLLPDLLLSMDYVAVSKPQTGVRQFGVDLAAVGTSPEDGVRELLLLVIKRGDIGRSDWDSGPQSVRQSLNEVLDVYLNTHVEPAHEGLRKRIVVATTGDLKQDTQVNWDSFVKNCDLRATFSFWSGDYISGLIERHMLDEHVFGEQERGLLRKSLALAGVADYDLKDLYQLFQLQLGLNNDGNLDDADTKPEKLIKDLRLVNLSTQIFATWADQEGNGKHALLAAERALVWSWHRICLLPEDQRARYISEHHALVHTYHSISQKYFVKIQEHLHTEDGLSGYCAENTELSLVVFEQIGLIATIGLSRLLVALDEEARLAEFENAAIVANGLAALLKNNPVSGSPRFDGNALEINLGMALFIFTRGQELAGSWLHELVQRIDYAFKCKRNFPICTDSKDDLVDASVFGDEDLRDRLMAMSWLLPTLAAWAVVLGKDDIYKVIAKNSKEYQPEICLQLWHPSPELSDHIYHGPAHFKCGASEAPIDLPECADEFRERMQALLEVPDFDIISLSPAGRFGMPFIDMIACRHFRTPVAPFFIYQLLGVENKKGAEKKTD